ncbi:MAG: hypothetical protein K1X54_04945 [Flavobacteriales bacterium]|nr:hypothetical protein [Flavobacteriales bacterium]
MKTIPYQTYRHLALLFLLLVGCKKSEEVNPQNQSNGDAQTSPKTLYACGYEATSSGKNIAKYWYNDQEVSLTDGQRDAMAQAIWVDGHDVHVVGALDQVNSNLNVPTYWLNGVETPLSNTGGALDNATDIFVTNDHIYISGFQYGPNFKHVAKLWIDGPGAIDLTDGTKDARATGVFVDGNDIYVCGYENLTSAGMSVAKYWKNGVEVNLTTGVPSAEASDIEVVNGDVYVSGTIQTSSGTYNKMVWINGVPETIAESPAESMGMDLSVSDGVAFVAGSNAAASIHSGYWTNGNYTALVPPDPFAPSSEILWSIIADGHDIYAGGLYLDDATSLRGVYWINGVAHPVGSTIYHDVVFDIFLK